MRAGYGRSYDIGVFGSTFGHSVTQNLPVLAFQELNPPNNFDSVFNLAQGPPAAGLPRRARQRPLPAAQRRVRARCCPTTQNLSHVDAYNVTVQRRALLHRLGGDRLRGQPRRGLLRRQPGVQRQRGDDRGLPGRRRATSAGRSSPATAGRRASTSSATPGKSRYNSLQAKLTKRFVGRLLAADPLHAAEPQEQRPATTSSWTPTSTTARPTSSASTCTCWRAARSCPSARASAT